MLILYVGSDAALAQSVELMLKTEDFIVTPTTNREEAVFLAKQFDHDLILTDDGDTRWLRTNKIKTPILVLSSKDVYGRVRVLWDGADDCLEKPFHKDELIARIHAIVRRVNGHATSSLAVGNLVIDIDKKTAEVGGAAIHLTCKEYQMLELLTLRKGATISKDMFLDRLYGGMDEPEVKIIDVFICRLRQKIARLDGGRSYIETVWGRGYRMREPAPNPINYEI